MRRRAEPRRHRLLRQRRILVLTAGVAAITAAVVLVWLSGSRDEAIGAASFTSSDLRDPGAVITFAGSDGSPAVLNFWASWCVPCRQEMPTLQQAHVRYGESVRFIGINHQDSRDAAIAFIDDVGVTYESVYDPDGDVAIAYGLFGLPTTVFVAADGTIVARRTGEITASELDERIDTLLEFAP